MKKILPGLLIITLIATAVSAETVIVDIEKCVELALSNNMGLQSSRLDVEIKKRAADLISYEPALKQLEKDVRKNFYNILVLEENLWLLEQNIEAANNRFEQAKINFKTGPIPELTVLSDQVGHENLKPAFTEMKLGFATMLDSISPWSKEQTGIRYMEDGITQIKLVIAQSDIGARMEIKTLIMKLNKSREQLETLILNISLANEAYRMSLEAYDEGSKELLEVKDSVRDPNTAKLEVLKEKYNYITGLLDLEYALNASLPGKKEISNE